MQTRQLGNSDLHITPVGYGAWAMGGSGWQYAGGQQDDDEIAGRHRRSAGEVAVAWTLPNAAVTGAIVST